MTIPSHLRWPVAIVGGLCLAGVTGLVASWASTGGWDTLRFVAFGACLVIPYVSVLHVLVGESENSAAPERHEDSVEMAWLKRALAATTVDLFIVLGVLTAFTSILDLDEPGAGLIFLLLMGDVAVRYLILSRREA